MTPRISLICAPPHPNPGMYSVDLAFDRFLDRQGLRADVGRYCYGGPHVATGLERHVLEYSSLEDELDDVLASDLILYWGDFHHAHVYWGNALRLRPDASGRVADDRAESARVARHLLLAGQPVEVLRKTLSFGTTLLGDDLRSVTTVDSAYRDAFPRFIEGCRRIWLRDPISAAQVSALRGARDGSCLGVDCVHLLTAEDYRSIAGNPASRRGYAGIYFGRMDAPMDEPARLAGKLARSAGLEPVWLPWLGPGSGAVSTFGQAISTLDVDASTTYEQLIAQVAGARLIVTDAYHLCLIAWRLGVPVICVGVGAQRPTRPISDKKKEIFHLTERISPLYLFHEEIGDRRRHPAIVGTVLELAMEPTVVAAVTRSLEAQSSVAGAELARTIEECLA